MAHNERASIMKIERLLFFKYNIHNQLYKYYWSFYVIGVTAVK